LLKAKLNPDEITKLENEIENWQLEIGAKDSSLAKDSKSTKATKEILKPVRGRTNTNSNTNTISNKKSESTSSSASFSDSRPLSDIVKETDDVTKTIKTMTTEMMKENRPLLAAHFEEVNRYKDKLGVLKLSLVEREYKAGNNFNFLN
jgi:hypothetical protein